MFGIFDAFSKWWYNSMKEDWRDKVNLFLNSPALLSYYYNNIVAEMLHEFFTAVFISESNPRILCIRQIESPLVAQIFPTVR